MALSNMTLVELPFFAEDAVLPESLPSCSVVKSSSDILSDQPTQRVVGVGVHFIVKYGRGVDLIEGQNMLYVRDVTSVSVPQVYAMFNDAESNENYIIMERINGKRLDHEWGSLNQDEKHAIASKLKRDFEELRKLPSPGGFCSLGGRPLSGDIFRTDLESSLHAGPFPTECELNEAMLRGVLHAGVSIHRVNFYRRAFSNVFQNHSPTYTHGDFHRGNIVIERVGIMSTCATINAARCDIHVFLLDWKYAGWFPCYWEYAMSLFVGAPWHDDWGIYVDKIMQSFPAEWSWAQKVLTDLWS